MFYTLLTSSYMIMELSLSDHKLLGDHCNHDPSLSIAQSSTKDYGGYMNLPCSRYIFCLSRSVSWPTWSHGIYVTGCSFLCTWVHIYLLNCSETCSKVHKNGLAKKCTEVQFLMKPGWSWHNPVSELYWQVFWPQGLVFALIHFFQFI